MDKEKIVYIIKEKIAEALDLLIDEIDDDENFMKLGLGSIDAFDIICSLKEEIGVEISPVALFEYKTINTFADYLVEGGDGTIDE